MAIAYAHEPVLEALAAIAEDVGFRNPSLDPDKRVPFVRPSIVDTHPRIGAFLDNLRDDPILRLLYPAEGVQPKWHSDFPPSRLAQILINAGLWNCALNNTITTDALLQYLRQALSDVATLINGGKLTSIVYVGFTARLPQGATISTPWGELREIRDKDNLLLQNLVPPGGIPHGSVLEVPQTYHWNILPTQSPGIVEIPGLDDNRWQRVALAALLTQPSSAPYASYPWFCVATRALSYGTLGGTVTQYRKGPDVQRSQLSELQEWTDLVSSPRLGDIAVRRTLKMKSERLDHIDSIIDGVITWENLFSGRDNSELSYRLSMNMACVLTSDPGERTRFQQRIKQLYGIRSSIVHGTRHPDGSEAALIRAEVEKLTLDVLKKLIKDHPNLVGAKAPDFTRHILNPNAVDQR